MKSVLVISFSHLDHDARVRRQIGFLNGPYRVTVACFDGTLDASVEMIQIARPPLSLSRKIVLGLCLLLRFYSIAYRLLHGHPELIRKMRSRDFDFIIANDIESVPLAFAIDPKAKIIFDSHEYAPRHFEDKLSWRIFFQPFNTALCREYIPRVCAMTTVSTGLAAEYRKNFEVEPILITNASPYYELEPSPTTEGIRMIHHGGATISRKLELMIDLMDLLDSRFTLDLMLVVPEFASRKTRNYVDLLRTRAAHNPRISFRPALKSSEIVEFINRYDLGLFLLPPVNFNYSNTLPNKLFDFIQARLGIAIGPTPEMAEVVRKFDLGIVSEDFTPEKLAARLNSLTRDQVLKFKYNAGKAARELNAGSNKLKFLALLAGLASRT